MVDEVNSSGGQLDDVEREQLNQRTENSIGRRASQKTASPQLASSNNEEAVNKEAQQVHEGYHYLKQAFKESKTEFSKIEKDKQGNIISADVTVNGKKVTDPKAKANLLAAKGLMDSLEGAMTSGKYDDYFKNGPLIKYAKELLDEGFNVENAMDGGLAALLVKTVAGAVSAANPLDIDSKVRQGIRAGIDPNSTLGQKLFDGVKSSHADDADKFMKRAMEATGLTDLSQVKQFASRLAENGDGDRNPPTIRNGSNVSPRGTPKGAERGAAALSA